MLTVSNLRAGYDGAEVLRDVSFHVNDSESVAILGPNGAGKTTLLMTLSGLINASAGDVTLNGASLLGLRRAHSAAASSRCWPSPGRCWPVLICCFWTNPPWDFHPGLPIRSLTFLPASRVKARRLFSLSKT